MADFFKDDDDEIQAISAINSALAKVKDEDARARVLDYILARYRPTFGVPVTRVLPSSIPFTRMATNGPGSNFDTRTSPLALMAASEKEVEGIARLTDNGELKITARDLKARSGLDAAVRLAHIAIYAHEQLTGQPLSSRKGLTPLLQQWRVYDGNARSKLAKERGIIRSGDNLTLDAHAKRDAERYIEEILSDDAPGQWRPK